MIVNTSGPNITHILLNLNKSQNQWVDGACKKYFKYKDKLDKM